jgi:hypothetical protein
MPVRFPSLEFFQGLRAVMGQEAERFRRLGYFDTTFGVEVKDGSPRRFVLSFDVFDCVDVREVKDLTPEEVDFILSGDLAVWCDMLANIRAHGGADAAHSINTLSHFGEGLQVLYDDPDGHDKLYRFAESVQAFFDLAARLEIEGIAPAPAAATEGHA